MIITIDGPTASGKSSVARALAHHISASYVYSGLLYRAIAYLLFRDYGYTHETISSVSRKHVEQCLQHIVYRYDPECGAQIDVHGENITCHLKTSDVDMLASLVSTNYYVRDAVYHLQHRIAASESIVIDGRDAGTVVFPQADVKFYLTAAEYIRAIRWRQDQKKRGTHYGLIDSWWALRKRDIRDMYRSVSPLQQAEDAYHIDNSQLNIPQTVALLYTVIRLAR